MTQFILIKMEIGEIGQPGVPVQTRAAKGIMWEVGNATIQLLPMVVYLVKAMEQNKDTAMKDLVQSVRVTSKCNIFLFQIFLITSPIDEKLLI